MVGPSVSPLGPMLRAEAIAGRRLLVAAWRRELGALCSAVAEIGGQTGDNNIDVQNAHSLDSTCVWGDDDSSNQRGLLAPALRTLSGPSLLAIPHNWMCN